MIEYTLVRKNVKNINLRVSRPSGDVMVSAPYFCPKILVDRFVRSKEDWIRKKQQEIKNSDVSNITEADRKVLKEKLEVLIPKWEAITGLKCSSWQVRNMKTRWGSCNTKTKKININLQLVHKPEKCLEYVILHELAHIKVPNHSKQFYDIIEAYMPDYKATKKLLNKGE